MKRLGFAAALLATLGVTGPLSAQTYPARPITLVVPYAAGGSNDTIARIVAERMRGALGQSIIIENVAGGNGTIAGGRVARSAPDGYTLIVGGFSTHVLAGATYALRYDVVKDFEPVALIASQVLVIVGRKDLPADNLIGLVGWLKSNPGNASAAHGGVGGADQVSGVLFQSITGTRFQYVPYRSAALAVQDVMAGHVDIYIGSPVVSLPQVRAGIIKAYAVAAKSRLAAAPDIPTADEAGLPGFYAATWPGLYAPKGTRQNVIAKLNAAAVDAMADPGVRERMADLGLEIPPREQQTPEALRALQKAEIEKWWPIIKAAGIKGE